VGITFGRLSPSYWIDYLGFITEGKLAAIFIKHSLGVSNWLVTFTSSTNANKFSGTIITAPSACEARKGWSSAVDEREQLSKGFVC
jgi:hypothetical protein